MCITRAKLAGDATSPLEILSVRGDLGHRHQPNGQEMEVKNTRRHRAEPGGDSVIEGTEVVELLEPAGGRHEPSAALDLFRLSDPAATQPRAAPKPIPPATPDPSEGQVRLIFRFRLFERGWGLHPEIRHVSVKGAVGRQVRGGFERNVAHTGKATGERNALGFMQHGHRKRLRGFSEIYSFPDQAPCGYVFRQLRDSVVYTEGNYRSRLTRHPDPIAFRLRVLVEGDNQYGLQLILTGPRDLEIIVDGSVRVLTVDSGEAFVYAGRVLYEAGNCPPVPLLESFLNGEAPSGLPFGAVMKWLDGLPPGLADGVARDLSGAVEPDLVRNLTGCRLRLCETVGGRLEAHVAFLYGDESVEVPAFPECRTKLLTCAGTLYRVERDAEKEAPLLEAIRRADLHALGDIFRLPGDTDPVRFILHELPRLEENGIEITGLESLRKFNVRRTRPRVSVAVQSGTDWFDLKVILDYDGIQPKWDELLEAVARGAEYITLPDGSLAPLDAPLREALGFLAGTARESPQPNALRLARAQILAAEDIVHLSDERRTDEKFDTSLARVRSFTGPARTEPSPGFLAHLRPYQQAGLDWLGFLRTHGFGGILADDMGLGKTIQTLAMLQLRADGSARTHLVVAPTSVVYNWRREVENFAPDLRVLEFTGAGRGADPAAFRSYDLVLTSYAILRRDAVILAQADFDYVVLDESQRIKNPQSQTFKAALTLSAAHRLCLTGTPVENSTTELWSQMQFANPGGLGSLNDFKDRFVGPIEKDGNRVAAERLRRITYPFILRRRKEDVAADLPARVEQVVYCEMEDEQRSVYEGWRDHYRALVLGAIRADGLGKSHMKVLEGLVKLRQISNHPALIEPSYTGASGKLDYLLETLEELRSEGHKVLIFSQFVKMLHVIRAELERQGVPYAYLDGKTRDRHAVVDGFQDDPNVPYFLISLRAGGVGLNLTAADHVILVDPWWNPAVETQAIDRAHRIGQDRSVFALKLITRGTVEEKILELQARKKQLAEDVIATDENLMKALSIEDIEALFGKSDNTMT